MAADNYRRHTNRFNRNFPLKPVLAGCSLFFMSSHLYHEYLMERPKLFIPTDGYWYFKYHGYFSWVLQTEAQSHPTHLHYKDHDNVSGGFAGITSAG